jgi:phosphatidylglycerol:prolipoprotein diacylglycerol transferase
MTIFEITLFWITISPTYYWLMYAIWFMSWYYIIKKRAIISAEKMDDLFFYIFLWVVLWWRFWYVLFYNISEYISHPLSIFKFWEWWMSFHGWVIGVILAMYLFSRKHKINFLVLSDQITLILPIWLWLWRIWNYLNKELLWYSSYNWFLSVEKNWVGYFPSSLVESLLEGLVLYFILLYFYNKSHKSWQIAALFLIFYWLFRIIVEMFFRMPDSQIWYILWYFTMWELLSFPMFIIWIVLYFRFK